MDLLDTLKENKGTVSSALGKALAEEVLSGNEIILEQAVTYVSYDLENTKAKGIRAGAAKILEKVAEKKPELVAGHLEQLKPALEVKEPQTRWMLMQVFGYCAALKTKEAFSVLEHAKAYLKEDAGVCLSGAVHLYLGRLGATSKENTQFVFPILDEAMESARENEIDWILEGFLSIVEHLDANACQLLKKHAEEQLSATKKSTQNRAKKLLKKIH